MLANQNADAAMVIALTDQLRPSTGAAGAVDRADQAACDAFVDAQYPRLFAWFCWLTGHRDRAADLTQESFAAFWESLGRKPVREPAIWLFRIARNRWRKACRARPLAPTGEHGLEAVPHRGPDPDHRIARDEFTQRVAACVLELPGTVREAVALHYWNDLSHDQIARVQGVPAALVRWRVHRGRRLLKDRLRRDGYGGGDL
jgi:RNA polymerase sigma-70 factor (ECF subfamily)